MKIVLLSTILILSLKSYSQSKITSEDLKVIVGSWEGSLTYLDYQTGKPFTMPANLNVIQGKKEDRFVLKNTYPTEPKANNSTNIKISKNGTLLNNNVVTLKEELDNGNIEIQTEHRAKDDNKKAIIRYTYIIGKDTFLIRKEVQFEQTDTWIKRNEFSYQRKK